MIITSHFDFEPTVEQEQAFMAFTDFVQAQDAPPIYVLCGAAGTGKTTLMQAFLSYLKEQKIEVALAAPTGRAARILSQRCSHESSTLHSLLYTVEEEADEEGKTQRVRFVRRAPAEDEPMRVYIVDEASMISNELDKNNFMLSEKPLLEDFIDFVMQLHPGNKIVFVGDKFQLPPVGSSFSPALDADYLQTTFEIEAVQHELNEVKRQEAESDIYKSAQILRESMQTGVAPARLSYSLLADEKEAVQTFIQFFDANERSKISCIGWRNEDVYRMNQQIRQQLFEGDDLLRAGEPILVNRTYMDEEDTLLTNGEIGLVKSIRPVEVVAGLRFAKATVAFETNSGRTFNHDCRICLDTLARADAWIDAEKSRDLYRERIRKNRYLRKRKDKRFDSYLNALQVRYGYAVTCHKAQGGEWDRVIIHPNVPPRSSEDFSRWLYTAVTRAKHQLYSFRK